MLAIKTVFQDIDPVQTLVFDEIDSGISGKAAEKVSMHLVQLAKKKTSHLYYPFIANSQPSTESFTHQEIR